MSQFASNCEMKLESEQIGAGNQKYLEIFIGKAELKMSKWRLRREKHRRKRIKSHAF